MKFLSELRDNRYSNSYQDRHEEHSDLRHSPRANQKPDNGTLKQEEEK